jgi:hypothetical protein
MAHTSDTQTVVMFHIGRGGRFNNGGHKTFKGVQDLTWPDYCTVIDSDEDGNPLPDEDWTLIEDACRSVLLEGKEAIESRTGKLDYDGEYDSDVFKYIGDCSDDELQLLKQAIDNHDIEAMDLTSDDIDYINEYVD